MSNGKASASIWGWVGLIAVMALIGAGYLYQREGGRIFRPPDAGVKQVRRGGQAQEHPAEHPWKHPQGSQQAGISKVDLADAIQKYVKKEADLKGGFFLVYDKTAGRTLTLTLDRGHRERHSRVAADTYFACADFKTPEGKTYDLDIFMKGPSKDKLQVTEISVHKENGKERYNWVEKNGVWSKVPLKKLEVEISNGLSFGNAG
jgi:hypothetical protein